MVKAKKKTKWRSLKLEDEPSSEDGASSTKNGGGGGGRTFHRMDWKVNGENNENGSHHNVTNGTTTTYKGRRDGGAGRPPKSNSKYYRPAALQSSSQINSQTTTEPTKKVQFNEDEYTKITTPRQDVLFKKGYLSRPKVHTATSTATTENGSLSIESTPSSNGVSSIDGEFPYYPSQHYLSDPLMNGSYYGNPVIFMPYPDLYYPPVPQGLESDAATFVASPYQNQPFSPPLESTCSDLASPQPLTSTDCSETSELSEEIITQQQQQNGLSTLSTSSTPPISVSATTTITTVDDVENDARSTNMQTTATMTASPIHSGYEMNQQQQPYYAPVYYVNFDVSQMPYYPYQAINSYDTVPEFYPIEVAAPEVPTTNDVSNTVSTSSSGTSTTDFSEDDLQPPEQQQQNATKKCEKPVGQQATETNNNIFKIAHQSTLNVEVKEFKPKSYESQSLSENSSKPKKNGLSTQTTSNGTTTATTTTNSRNRSTLNKKFIRESTKQIEMQNIDLSKSSKLETATGTIEWVIKGGKRVPIKVAPPPTPTAAQTKSKSPEPCEPSSVIAPQSESSVPSTTATSTNNKKTTNKKANKPKKNPKNKNGGLKVAKFEGFVIEEPTFTKTERRISNATAAVDDDEDDENGDEDAELQEAAMIEEIPWTEAEVEIFNGETEELPAAQELVQEHQEEEEKEDEVENIDECRHVPEERESFDIIEERQVPNHLEDEEKLVEQVNVIAEPEIILPEIREDIDENTEQHVEELLRPDYTKMNGFAHLNGESEHYETPTIQLHYHTQLETLEELEEPTSVRQSPEIDDPVVEPVEVVEVIERIKPTSKLNGMKSILEVPTAEPEPEIEEPKKKNGLSTESKKPLRPVTAAVCNWLHTFTQPDLQTLFTIPLHADFVRKIRHCSEISTYFKDDELENLEQYVNEQFYQYELCSSDSSTSDYEDDDDDSQSSSQNTRKKFFGCKIM